MNDRSQAKASVDLRVYTMEAVLKSSYRFTKICFIEIDTLTDHSVEVRIRAKRPDENAESIHGDFLNDLIDQRLRTIIAEETSVTRDRIMAHALSQSGFIRPDLESADHRDDPLQIGKPDRARVAS